MATNPIDIVNFYIRYPHLKDKIQLTWGTRECRRFLTSLIDDAREGNRQGFPNADAKIIFDLLSEHDKKFPVYDTSDKIIPPFTSHAKPHTPPSDRHVTLVGIDEEGGKKWETWPALIVLSLSAAFLIWLVVKHW